MQFIRRKGIYSNARKIVANKMDDKGFELAGTDCKKKSFRIEKGGSESGIYLSSLQSAAGTVPPADLGPQRDGHPSETLPF